MSTRTGWKSAPLQRAGSRPVLSCLLAASVLSALATGCANSLAWMEQFSLQSQHRASEEEAQRQREEFQTERTPESIRWLLANRVSSGMSLQEVTSVLGERGERQHRDRWLLTESGHYRVDDNVFKWGPDSNGRSYYLVFRGGQLVNFDPYEFRD